MARTHLTVVQLLPALDAGGVERGTLEIAEALVDAGHRSIVISTGGRLVDELERAGSEHMSFPISAKRPWTLLGVRPLRRLFESLDADVVHARSRVPAWLTYLAWRRMPPVTRPRFVTTVHGFYSVNRYSAVMTRGERVIAVSDAIQAYVAENYRIDMDKVVTIHRGIDRASFPHGFAPSDGWLNEWGDGTSTTVPDDTPLITLPGRLTRLKGHETFIDLIAELLRRDIPAHGLIVGGEDAQRQPYAQALYERAADLPITFLGHRQDLREIMARSKMILSLSKQPESFGRTVLEALSLGRPVIGFDHGGVGEILATLYPQGRVEVDSDTGTLADKVSSFLVNPPAVPDHSRFTLEAMQSRTLALYEELVDGPSEDRPEVPLQSRSA